MYDVSGHVEELLHQGRPVLRQHRLRMVHLVPNAQGQAGVRARLGDQAVERGSSSTRQENVWLIREIPPGNSVGPREAVPLRERNDQPLRHQGLRHRRLLLDRWPKDAGIDPAVLQG